MDTEQCVTTLLTGTGHTWLRGAFDADAITAARDIVEREAFGKTQKVTHFHGHHEDEVQLQRRVWNLLNKGQVFVDMVQHPEVMDIVGAFLGDEFILGSIAANLIMSGGPGQEPHVDYPYWDMYKRSSFPRNVNASFALNCQVTVLLDDFTEENGATAFLPGTQALCRYPQEDDAFYDRCDRMLGKAGDVVIFNGLVWHCAMPNRSARSRSAILIQYLPKFVKPMEDQLRGVAARVQESASPMLRQLLGMNYPYPQLLDDAEAGNTEGRYTRSRK
jgi:hypothetical protein